ncbi:MAG: hypothetical protein H0W90_00975 [Actinobacteria bacterium]|nr:hypothetical protein [Actinomycetota bacterium]
MLLAAPCGGTRGNQAATIHFCLDVLEAALGDRVRGLPLLPGLGAGGNSNVAISLSSAVLGVQESQTFRSPNNLTGRQARLLSLLLPAGVGERTCDCRATLGSLGWQLASSR